MTNMIEASGLVKRYKEVTALAGLDLVVPEGVVLGLLGPNGAGKTTAVSILSTLLEPDEGQAMVAGADVRKDPKAVRRLIGLSGQYAAVDEHLTGFENLDMIGRLYHLGKAKSRERARELLEIFDLTEAGDRPVKTYSGGMRRRLDLAGALVAKPPVLFLDEPSSGLDPRSRVDLWETIRDLVKEGATLLLTTQYLEEADQLADDIVVIDHGREIAHGSADQLKTQVGGERIEVTVADRCARDSGTGSSGRVRRRRDPHRSSQPGSDRADSRRRPCPNPGAARARCARDRGSGCGSAPPDTRRCVPDPDRSRRRGRGRVQRRQIEETQGRRARGGQPMSQLMTALGDGAVVAKRNVIKIKRVPEILVFVLLSPIMFVFLFAFVFGGAIEVASGAAAEVYREFLIAGILAQTVIFGATFTGAGLADDIQKGIIDRFRSLPMARSAVLVGRTSSDVVYNALSVAIMALTGLLVGWAIRTSFLEAAMGFGLLLLFAYAFSWVMAYVGLLVPSVEVINNASFMVIFPITFVSNAFVPLETLPAPLQTFAEWNPVSSLTQAVRELFGNIPAGAPEPTAWPLQNPIIYTLIWIVIIMAIFVPISIRQYRRAARR